MKYGHILTLQVGQTLAHELPEDEVPEQRPDEREGHAEHAKEEVRHGQVQQEHVGDGAHALVVAERQDHQAVADDGQEEDGRVQRHLHPTVRRVQPPGHVAVAAGVDARVRGPGLFHVSGRLPQRLCRAPRPPGPSPPQHQHLNTLRTPRQIMSITSQVHQVHHQLK